MERLRFMLCRESTHPIMIKPPIPADEELRLAALKKYQVLDTAPEIAYDDITFLASQICGTPIAAISLIDRNRQWFKSKVGFDIAETPRDIAFCAHAIIDHSRPLIVEDARVDERFRDNPLVTGDVGLRFYAGAPLVTSDGHALGTLCVIDQQPRNFADEARHALEILSREVVSQLELRWALRELERTRLRQLELKDQFLSHISHELRTPLTVVFQFVSILLDGIGGELSPIQREYLGIVDRNAKQLRMMIGDLIEVTRMRSGKIELNRTAVELGRVVADVLESLKLSADLQGVRLSADIAPMLPFAHADPVRLRQILTNLLENALKFSAKGGSVTVSARSHDVSLDFVHVSVTDEGCGIASEECDRIFEQLYQIQQAQPEARAGLGLGLHICKDLVSRHGGDIWAESDPGRGTTFHFTLPVITLRDWVANVCADRSLVPGSVSLLSVEMPCGAPHADRPNGHDRASRAWLAIAERLSPEHRLVPGVYDADSGYKLFVLVSTDCPDNVQLETEISGWIESDRLGGGAPVPVQTETHILPLKNEQDATDTNRDLPDAIVEGINTLVVEKQVPEEAA